MNKFFPFFIVAGMLVILGACNPNLVFEQYQSIDNRSWDKDSILVFNIPVSDTISNHNIYINVRNDVNYSYSNLWLFVTIRQAGGDTISDKFEITLANLSGKWIGEGLGGLKTREVMYKRNVFFPTSGEYKITVQQGMREDVLKGISDVGIRIEKAR